MFLSARSANASVIPEVVDMSNVPSDYHDFEDVFSKGKADALPERCSCDLSINIEEGARIPYGLVYSLSQSELVVL